MTAAQVIGVIVTLLGAATSLTALWLLPRQIKKLRADTTKVDAETENVNADTAVMVATGEDQHWLGIIKTQTESLVEPMQKRLDVLEAQVAKLEEDLMKSRQLQRSAIGYIRLLLRWVNQHLAEVTEPVPPPPADIASEL